MMVAGREVEPAWAVRVGFFALPLTAFAIMVAVTRPPVPGHRVVASFGGRAYDLLVADTARLRQRGLQGYDEPVAGRGMLFAFDEPQQVTMVMKTVDFPIDVAFVDADMHVVRTVSMKPQPYGIQEAPSGVPVKYVIEARAGSLMEDGVTPGSRFALVREVE